MERLGLKTAPTARDCDTIDSKRPPQGPGLTTIASELRLTIFDYLLIVDDVFVRWNYKAARYDIRFHDIFDRDVENRSYQWRAPDGARTVDKRPYVKKDRARGVWFWDDRWHLHKPQTQLFRVCKLLRDEAMHHYLAHNIFHIMGTDCGLPYLD